MNRIKRTLGSTLLTALLACTIVAAASAARPDAGSEWMALAQAAIEDSHRGAEDRRKMMTLVMRAVTEATGVAMRNGNGAGNGGVGVNEDRRVAALAVAASAVLEVLAPEQREHLQARLAVTLSRIEENDAKAEGVAIGRRIAMEVLGR